MNIEILKKNLSKLNLYRWKLIQTSINSLVVFKTKYKYTDCIYINIDKKYLKLHIERLIICQIHINKEGDLIKYIEDMII